MTDKFKAAFDGIRADHALKEKTLAFLQNEIQTDGKPRIRLAVKRFAAVAACLLCVTLAGLLYFTETAYIDLDVNPTFTLAVNRFDRVVGANAVKPEGDEILTRLDVKHKTYKDSIELILDALAQTGYLRDDGLVSVTLQTNDSEKETKMLSELELYVQTGVAGHHCAAQVDVFPVSGDLRNDAQALDLSPAKYLAILKLQEVDPNATVEGCRGHTIGELNSMAEAHAPHHAKNGGMMRGNGMMNGGKMGHGGHGGGHG